jgi:hypothetical protein
MHGLRFASVLRFVCAFCVVSVLCFFVCLRFCIDCVICDVLASFWFSHFVFDQNDSIDYTFLLLGVSLDMSLV